MAFIELCPSAERRRGVIINRITDDSDLVRGTLCLDTAAAAVFLDACRRAVVAGVVVLLLTVLH